MLDKSKDAPTTQSKDTTPIPSDTEVFGGAAVSGEDEAIRKQVEALMRETERKKEALEEKVLAQANENAFVQVHKEGRHRMEV